MTGNTDEPGPAAEAPPPRASDLSEAVLRISASLDVTTVLQQVVESARALTGAVRSDSAASLWSPWPRPASRRAPS